MTASITAMWATIILAALGAFFAGPGLGVLAGILGTVAVVVLAMREENEKARDARRRVLREAAWRETARAMRENGEQA
jgi:multisubunit Na+/H+ antiporter MnhB subunit